MPYYKEINTLLIHIPKTGGTSLEEYLKTKYTESVFSHVPINDSLNDNSVSTKSLQHLPYASLRKFSEKLNLDFNDNNMKILSIVRNPYHRMVSDLFFLEIIDYDFTQEEVCTVIKYYLEIYKSIGYIVFVDKESTDYAKVTQNTWIFNKYNNYDNHRLPQFKFLVDENDKLIDKIKIFRTETLTKELREYGFSDYEFDTNKSVKIDYMKYLNDESIQIINSFYKKDFEMFGYEYANLDH